MLTIKSKIDSIILSTISLEIIIFQHLFACNFLQKIYMHIKKTICSNSVTFNTISFQLKLSATVIKKEYPHYNLFS